MVLSLPSVLSFAVFSLIFAWCSYNGLILVAGIKHLKNSHEKKGASSFSGDPPTISIIIPAKNEEKVIGRCLEAFLRVDYPREKMEVIVVEDGSKDKTAEICAEYAERYPGLIRLLRKPNSNGKPSALNFGLKHARGEIIGVFDADSVPEPDVLKKVAYYFSELRVEALQGRTLTINADENALAKLTSYEEALRYMHIQGKEVLDLFVPFTGSCYFVKKRLLMEVGGWDECLSEDMELAAKLLERGVEVKYAPDVRCWQEVPSRFRTLYRQRKRWFRGSMEVALRYGRLLKRLDKRSLDAEATLAGPFMFVPCLLGYFLGALSTTSLSSLEGALGALAQLFLLANVSTLFIIGAALSCIAESRGKARSLWVPLVYAYWMAQIVVALHALVELLSRRPAKWERTEKTGAITAPHVHNQLK
jgi:cellulose synthase/poly-beta-1,6-N-acetylglucosamine synthase-like glycosyltransferase